MTSGDNLCRHGYHLTPDDPLHEVGVGCWPCMWHRVLLLERSVARCEDMEERIRRQTAGEIAIAQRFAQGGR